MKRSTADLNRRRSRWAVVLVLLMMQAMGMADPASAHSMCTRQEVRVLVTYHGVVTSRDNAPIQFATVTTGIDSAQTNRFGHYTVNAWHDCPVNLSVSHPLFVGDSIHSDNPAVDSQSPKNFTLAYRLTTRVTPKAFNPALTTPVVQTDTTAPPATTKVSATTSAGQTISLSRDTTAQMPSGWTRWEAPLPAGTSLDGVHEYRSCALKAADAVGTCAAPGNALLSDVITDDYIVDRQPPRIDWTSPAADADRLDRRPTITIQLGSDLSGIDGASIDMRIDGASVSPSLTGTRLTYIPASDLPLGTRLVTLSVRDGAGNQMAPGSLRFGIATLATTTTMARVAPRTEPIMPGAASVTFSNVAVEFDPFNATLSSNLGTGYGTIARNVDLSEVRVVFANHTTSTTTSAGGGVPSSARYEAEIGALGSSPESSTATVPGGSVGIGSVTVHVPVEYRVAGATATLQMDDTTAGPASATGDLLPDDFDGAVLVTAAANTQTRYQGNETGGSVSVGSGFTVSAQAPGISPRPVAVMVTSLAGTTGFAFSVPPKVSCNGNEATPYPCIRDGALRPATSTLLFPGTGVELYSNRWTARSSSTAEYLAWHQTSANVADVACDPQGTRFAPTTLKGMETEAKQTLLATDGRSAWYVKSFIGRQSHFGEGPRDLPFGDLEAHSMDLDPDAGFNPDLDSAYTPHQDPFATTLGPLGTRVTWDGEVRNGARMMASGTSFAPSSSSADHGGLNIDLLETDSFELTIDFARCAP